MAEHSAHLTANLQLKPSIFEVVAADSLQSSFYPAIKRVCIVSINGISFLLLVYSSSNFFKYVFI